MPKPVYIRFERGRDGVIGPTYGPYQFVQVTYTTIRNDKDEDLAYFNVEEHDWILVDHHERDEFIFSDFIVYSL